jgi:outer membrane protein assembly factor BamB
MRLKYLCIIRNRIINKLIIPLVCCVLLSLNACNTIEKKNDLPNKKDLEPIVNPFQVKKILDKKIIDLNSRDILNSAILLTNNKKQLFIADFSGKVTSVDFHGKHLWSKSLDKSVTAGPVLFEDKLLVITSEAKLFCLQAKNGEILWSTAISSDALAAPAVHSGTAFIHTLDGGLSAISLQDGRQLWRISTVLPNMTLRRGSAPVISGNYVITGFANGKLFAVNKENGNVVWAHNLSNPKGRSELQRITDITADPVIVNNVVYAVSYQGNLTAIKLSSGEPLWEKELSSYSGIIVDENAVYISTVDGKVLAIDNKTGTIFWVQDDLQGRNLSKPIIFNKYLVVGDQDGNLHFLDQLYGYIKGRLFLDSSGISISPLIINKNQLYVLTNNGYLEVIEIS